jgi:hypothetical protein
VLGPHAAPPFLFSRTTFARYDSYEVDKTSTNNVEAFLGRPYSILKMGSDDGITSSFMPEITPTNTPREQQATLAALPAKRRTKKRGD